METMDTRGGDATEEEETSEEFLLLEIYCALQHWRRLPRFQGLGSSRAATTTGISDQPPGPSLTAAVNCLADIADSVPIAEDDLQTDSIPDPQQELVEKLVLILKKEGDYVNEKIQQDEALCRLLQGGLSYSLFKNLMAALQGVVGTVAALRSSASASAAAAPAPCREQDRLQREQIARTFEVTRRLAAIDQIPRRQALTFGSRYLQQHYSGWVQQHGGWAKAIVVEEID